MLKYKMHIKVQNAYQSTKCKLKYKCKWKYKMQVKVQNGSWSTKYKLKYKMQVKVQNAN